MVGPVQIFVCDLPYFICPEVRAWVPITVIILYMTLVQNRCLLLNILRVACLIIKLIFLNLFHE